MNRDTWNPAEKAAPNPAGASDPAEAAKCRSGGSLGFSVA